MIYICFIKNRQLALKKAIAKQTGFTKLTKTGLIVMLFFRKICVCHR